MHQGAGAGFTGNDSPCTGPDCLGFCDSELRPEVGESSGLYGGTCGRWLEPCLCLWADSSLAEKESVEAADACAWVGLNRGSCGAQWLRRFWL